MAMRFETRWGSGLLVAALLSYVGCSDDGGSSGGNPDAGSGGQAGGTGAGTGGNGATSGDGGSGGSGASAGAGGSAGDAGPSPNCEPTSLEGRLDTGAWDDRFTIPGLTGFDGYVPAVHGFARDVDGSLLVAGYFQWAGRERVGALARLRDGVWQPARTDLPSSSLSAVAMAADGRMAVSSFAPLLPDPSAPGQAGKIYVDRGSGFESIGEFTGVVRTLAWVGDQLWVAGHVELDGGPAELALWNESSGWSPPPGGAADGPVYALLVEEDSVVVGGWFSETGGISARSAAEWTGSE